MHPSADGQRSVNELPDNPEIVSVITIGVAFPTAGAAVGEGNGAAIGAEDGTGAGTLGAPGSVGCNPVPGARLAAWPMTLAAPPPHP